MAHLRGNHYARVYNVCADINERHGECAVERDIDTKYANEAAERTGLVKVKRRAAADVRGGGQPVPGLHMVETVEHVAARRPVRHDMACGRASSFAGSPSPAALEASSVAEGAPSAALRVNRRGGFPTRVDTAFQRATCPGTSSFGARPSAAER